LNSQHSPIQYKWTSSQKLLYEQSFEQRIFLSGPAGSGKTTSACNRLIQLLENGVPGESILVLVPQRTLAEPYKSIIDQAAAKDINFPESIVPIQMVTVGGLARRIVELFWPIVSEQAGFLRPDLPPVFLTLETTQFFMGRTIRPFLDQGAFSSIHMERNRLYSQIIDNLNKSAVVGFPITEISQRLKNAWVGEPGQLRVYDDAQLCALSFRNYCLENNLLDFSLQVELFMNYLWSTQICRKYLMDTYKHLIVDNIEEDTPACHSLVRDWLDSADSALILYDTEAGYRRFLGADPNSAWRIRTSCDVHLEFNESIVNNRNIQYLAERFRSVAVGERNKPESQIHDVITDSIFFTPVNYYPEMLDWTADQIAILIAQGIPKSEIAVLSPYLSDSLRFSLSQRLEQRGIATRSHRPSRALRDEPITNCLITLARLAHPHWSEFIPGFEVKGFDVTCAFMQAIEGMDLVRAQLLVENVLKNGELRPFMEVTALAQDRITYRLGQFYENLRIWLSEYHAKSEKADLDLDHFLHRLFGEVLSQPGYGFHPPSTPQTMDGTPLFIVAGEITANLIESVRKFRKVISDLKEDQHNKLPVGLEYLLMVQDGVLAAQYIRSWAETTEDAVLLAPAYTFLLSNRPVDYQFWLDIGSRSWAERVHQPLTHPFVLSQTWPNDRTWTDLDEMAANHQILIDLVTGLVRRCRKKIFLGISNLGEQGYEQRGSLLRLFQQVLYTDTTQ